MNRSSLIACIIALIGSLWGLLMSMAVALSLWDGPSDGELRGYDMYSGTVLFGCISTVLLFVACYKNNTRMARLVVLALLICANILLVASVIFLRSATPLRPRAYVSLPLPLALWAVAAGLVLWKSGETSTDETVFETEEAATMLEEGLLAVETVDG